MNADFEYRARNIDIQWQQFYAKHIIEHFAPADTLRSNNHAPAPMALVIFHNQLTGVNNAREAHELVIFSAPDFTLLSNSPITVPYFGNLL